MCGISGFLELKKTFSDKEVCEKMARSLKHRGPDSHGIWQAESQNVSLVHTRLSIQDLSVAGDQPMRSYCARYVIVFNGEIYNHLDLRKKISEKGGFISWKGHSDTETLLNAISVFGIKVALSECVGMFAFALWDRKEEHLILARDRLGEKPLYYGWQKDTFLFGSELKALRQHPSFANEIDRNALTLLFRHNAIPTPYSIYEGIKKVEPGTFVLLKYGEREPYIEQYWSLKDIAENKVSNGPDYSAESAISELENVMLKSVSDQMISDVPLGGFLSGGVDSSLIIALMQAQSVDKIKTFSIGFDEKEYNEACYAKDVARHLGTEHTELYVSSVDALDVVQKLPYIFDEPFSDSSQIPTYLLSSMTREFVTVAISGDGGDELFGGYNRHFLVKSIWNRIQYLPASLKKAVANFLVSIPPQLIEKTYSIISYVLPNRMCFNLPADKLRKLADLFFADSPELVYRNLISHWKDPAQLVIGGAEPLTVLTGQVNQVHLPDFENKMMFMDTVSYLPDDILTKVDRTSMSVSLETRVPMLDHRLVEFAWGLPLDMKIRNGEGKWILKQLLYKYVPKRLIDRPKMGFAVPIDKWLRTSLKDWAETLLDKHRLDQEGFLRSDLIRKKWEEHLSGKRNWQYHLWDVLMFQQWLETNKS